MDGYFNTFVSAMLMNALQLSFLGFCLAGKVPIIKGDVIRCKFYLFTFDVGKLAQPYGHIKHPLYIFAQMLFNMCLSVVLYYVTRGCIMEMNLLI